MNSRKLNVSEYLKVLQLEYLTYKVRSLIFERPEFVKMNSDIAIKKKEKIEDLTKRFCLTSIFDSQYSFQNFLNENFLNESGLPNFQYSLDEEKRKAQIYWDKKYLLKPGTSVFFKDIEYIVQNNYSDNDMLLISLNKEVCTVSYSDIKIKNLMTCFDGRLI